MVGRRGEQDGAGAGGSAAEEIEEVVADDEGIGGVDVEGAAGVQDGEGVGLDWAVLSGDDTIEGKAVLGADALDAVAAIARDQGEGILALAAVGEDLVDAGIEPGVLGGVEFVSVEDCFGSASLLGVHGLHGFKDGACGNADFGTDLVEIEAGFCNRAVEIEDNRGNCHSGGHCRSASGRRQGRRGLDRHNCL